LDTPGIVHAITGVLKSQNINIEDLESEARLAPLSGSPMFSMKIAVTILPGAPLKNLKAALAQVAMEHDLDIEVRPLIAE
jgi:glycine cleavage system regulatory protein